MVDTVTTVTKTGFLGRLGNSVKGVFIGFIIFIAAFPLLWWCENRQNLAEFVTEATQIAPQGKPTVEVPALIKTTGTIASNERARDSQFLPGLSGENILKISRRAEMYSWKEKVETRKEGDKEIKTYTYTKKWTTMPQKSANFHLTDGHFNPAKAVDAKSFQVTQAKVGDLSFNAGEANFYKSSPLTINKTDALNAYNGQDTMLSNGGQFLYLTYVTGKKKIAPVKAVARFDPQTGQPINPPARFDPQTGKPIVPAPVRYDPQTGRPLPPPVEGQFNPQTGQPLVQKAVMRDPELEPIVGDLRLSYSVYEGNKEGTVVAVGMGAKLHHTSTEKQELF